jgi:ATP-dependent helicase/nuclease subunit A
MEVMAMTDDSGMSVISDTTLRQNLAATPTLSAWVSANAGSGKTHVLARRVIRLLLRGARPSAILCLTYTKAASAEMSNRIFRTLGEWVRLDDAGLAERIAELEGREAEPHQLVRARRLFATALETPGGLKIQTIHAFCEAVLHRFPLEANIPGHFSVLDDQKAAELAGRGAPPSDVGAVIRERSGSCGCRHCRARHRRRGRLRQTARRPLCPPPRLPGLRR